MTILRFAALTSVLAMVAASLVTGLQPAASAATEVTLSTGPLGNTCPIPDGGAVTCSELLSTDSRQIIGVEVGIRVSHTWVGDLEIDLLSPDPSGINLVNRLGVPETTFGRSDDDYGKGTGCDGPLLWFSDDAAANIGSLAGGGGDFDGLTGTYQPEGGPLSNLAGERADGTWSLQVTDHANEDTGQIDCFEVRLQLADPGITIDKTVGTTPGDCAATSEITVDAATDVYYCYTVTNSGDLPLEFLTVDDDHLGDVIDLVGDGPSPLSANLGPTETWQGITGAVTIDQTTTNVATADMWNDPPGAVPIDQVQATDTAVVTVAEEPTTTTTTTIAPVTTTTAAAQPQALAPTFTG